jgi:long-chain acyl-CoA synthetase
MGLYDFSFYQAIKRNSVIHGSRPCWHEVESGEELSFAELRRRVESLAAGLQRQGLGKGDRLGVVGKNSLEFFLLYGAAAALGAIVVPVNWRLSPEEMAYNLGDGGCAMVFVDEEFQAGLSTRREQLPTVTTWYNLRGDLGQEQRFAALCLAEAAFTPAAVGGDDGFVIIHTAAVAGRPRGALLSHNNILVAALQFNITMRLEASDVHLNLLPLFHVAGLFLALASFQAGAVNVNLAKFEADKAPDLIARHRVSLLFDFPPILDSLLKAAGDQADLSSLRAVVGLGTAETIKSYQEKSGGWYYVMYGQTEASCLTTFGKYDDRPGSAGRGVLLADIVLVDENDHPVAPGEVGEITVSGPTVFKGYWNLPEDNDATFRGGRHHTGDLGRFDEDGYLFYAGRKAEKELIKPGGENVYPAEVEKVILEHPAVAETVVFGVPDAKWKEGIKAVCRLHPGESLVAEELISFVGQRIAGFKKPRYVEFVESLPKLASGAIDRAAVKARYTRG